MTFLVYRFGFFSSFLNRQNGIYYIIIPTTVSCDNHPAGLFITVIYVGIRIRRFVARSECVGGGDR